MRTIKQISRALEAVNVQALHRASGVNAKTIYRIKANPEYRASAADAEKLSNALDQMERADLKAPKRTTVQES